MRMLDLLLNRPYLQTLTPEQLRKIFLSAHPNFADRVAAMEGLLRSPAGPFLREQVGKWVIQHLPSKQLVPDKYSAWRPLVADAMLFVFLNLSIQRLAPKLVEQMELPPHTSVGERLLKLIARVPGLQKLGQVLARNRQLQPSLRRSLTKLENGISDMTAGEVRRIIRAELKTRLKEYAVQVQPGIFSEASVSAVMRFSWRNPETRKRERGVFKVMKPHIPVYFAEDLDILAGLAKHVARKHREYGFAKRVLPDTFDDVRQLLKHEVEFTREQATLQRAWETYGLVIGIRVPRLIAPLCTARITAMTEERGTKVTEAAVKLPAWKRVRISESLLEASLAVPLFWPEKEAMFHADPHAGNLLYNPAKSQLVILDWALTQRVGREDRRHLALLFFMTALRDPDGICNQIQLISRGGMRRKSREAKLIRACVDTFISRLPVTEVPGAAATLGLLENIVLQGVRLPAPLIMLRKVLFTLDGVQHDIGGPQANVLAVLARHATPRWLSSWKALGAPLMMKDWLTVQSSAISYGGRIFRQGTWSLLDRLKSASATA
jgi:ubiquinone biosynthesis protein